MTKVREGVGGSSEGTKEVSVSEQVSERVTEWMSGCD